MNPEMDRKPENKAPTEPFPYPKSKGPKRPLKERWATYQPNKISMYKAVGYSVFLTIAVGFTLGGWHTRGGTQEVAREARIDYAAQVCADRFMAADAADQNLADLKAVQGRYQRRHALEQGDWVTVTSELGEEFVRETSLRCGDRLVADTQPPTTG
jgi:hypothetical protein